ncbi:MAG: DNA helicase UvrD, partial [Candidatus Sungbacteria bacterium]|nr:DNA helicase UvrD [Candidatus Sungbacteria bacterium]
VGVMYRVDELADRPPGGKPSITIPFKSLVQLDEIIAESFGMGVQSKKVKNAYQDLTGKIGSEFAVLVDASRALLEDATSAEIVEGIMRVREGKLHIEPGYDGEYGKVKIFEEGEAKRFVKQVGLF